MKQHTRRAIFLNEIKSNNTRVMTNEAVSRLFQQRTMHTNGSDVTPSLALRPNFVALALQ